MRKLYDAADRFCARHPRFGVPDLMRYIVIGNVVVFFLIMLTRGTNANALNFLYFDPQMVLRGEVWRIVTYIFVPSTTRVFWLVVELYFYYWIGSTLEREWGTARFNLYYWSGVLLTVIGALLASAITGGNFTVAGTSYVNLSMFLAFALLFPNTQVLLMFIIPVKMKWLAYIDVGLFAVSIVRAILVQNWGGVILPVMALLNFLIFAWPTLQGWAQRRQYQHSRQAVNFKKAVHQQQKQHCQLTDQNGDQRHFCQRGDENAQCSADQTEQEETDVSADQALPDDTAINGGDDGVEQGGNQHDQQNGRCCQKLCQHDLCHIQRAGEQQRLRTVFPFLRKRTHGEQRDEEDEVEQIGVENRGEGKFIGG